MVKKMAENPQTSVPNQTPGKMEVVISAAYESDNITEYIYLLKDDVGEFYLLRAIYGWKQISDIQKAWDVILRHKYYIDKAVVPLLYYILATKPLELDKLFQFLYNEDYITYEEDS